MIDPTTLAKKAIITDYEQGGRKVVVTVGESSKIPTRTL